MLEQDYIIRLLVRFADAIRRSLEATRGDRDPADAAALLESAIGEATDIDGEVLLSLSPDSIASVLQVSGTDPMVMEYLARSLLLASEYLEQANDKELSALREAQAYALAEAYEIELDHDDITPEAFEEFFANEPEQ